MSLLDKERLSFASEPRASPILSQNSPSESPDPSQSGIAVPHEISLLHLQQRSPEKQKFRRSTPRRPRRSSPQLGASPSSSAGETPGQTQPQKSSNRTPDAKGSLFVSNSKFESLQRSWIRQSVRLNDCELDLKYAQELFENLENENHSLEKENTDLESSVQNKNELLREKEEIIQKLQTVLLKRSQTHDKEVAAGLSVILSPASTTDREDSLSSSRSSNSGSFSMMSPQSETNSHTSFGSPSANSNTCGHHLLDDRMEEMQAIIETMQQQTEFLLAQGRRYQKQLATIPDLKQQVKIAEKALSDARADWFERERNTRRMHHEQLDTARKDHEEELRILQEKVSDLTTTMPQAWQTSDTHYQNQQIENESLKRNLLDTQRNLKDAQTFVAHLDEEKKDLSHMNQTLANLLQQLHLEFQNQEMEAHSKLEEMNRANQELISENATIKSTMQESKFQFLKREREFTKREKEFQASVKHHAAQLRKVQMELFAKNAIVNAIKVDSTTSPQEDELKLVKDVATSPIHSNYAESSVQTDDADEREEEQRLQSLLSAQARYTSLEDFQPDTSLSIANIEASPNSGYKLSPTDAADIPIPDEDEQDMLNTMLINSTVDITVQTPHHDETCDECSSVDYDQDCNSDSMSLTLPDRDEASSRMVTMICTTLMLDAETQTEPMVMPNPVLIRIEVVPPAILAPMPTSPPPPPPKPAAQLMTSPLAAVQVQHRSSASFDLSNPHQLPSQLSPTRRKSISLPATASNTSTNTSTPAASSQQKLPTPTSSPQSSSSVHSAQQEAVYQHRMALLSKVGRVLSVFTGESPMAASVARSTTAMKQLVPTPSVRAALDSVIKAHEASPIGDARFLRADSVAFEPFPLPEFALSPADRLMLDYLYRYLRASWTQSFMWLPSCPAPAPALWIEDHVSGHCFSCQKHFTVFRRIHHCRLCGGLFCSTCSHFRVDVDNQSLDNVRSCLRCFGAHQSMTMSNSLSLWEQKGTKQPPKERRFFCRSKTNKSLKHKEEEVQLSDIRTASGSSAVFTYPKHAHEQSNNSNVLPKQTKNEIQYVKPAHPLKQRSAFFATYDDAGNFRKQERVFQEQNIAGGKSLVESKEEEEDGYSTDSSEMLESEDDSEVDYEISPSDLLTVRVGP